MSPFYQIFYLLNVWHYISTEILLSYFSLRNRIDILSQIVHADIPKLAFFMRLQLSPVNQIAQIILRIIIHPSEFPKRQYRIFV